MKILVSAVKNEFWTRINEHWIQKWKTDIIDRTTHKIIKKFIKNIFEKFRFLNRFENAMIVQIRTKKIDFKNYLYKINFSSLSTCSCEYKKQTIHHTLLKCSRFNEFRKKMWTNANKRETNLIRFLNTFALIAKIFKFLLITNECQSCTRH